MKHSIRFKITFIIFACSLCIVGVTVLVNTLFLDKFYLKDKEKLFQKTYKVIDGYLSDYTQGTIDDAGLKNNLEMVTARSNISIMVIDNDWSIVYASMRDVDSFIRRLQSSMFAKIMAGDDMNEIEGASTVLETDNYTLYEIYNDKMDDTYLELIGNMSNGTMIYMSLGVRSMQENVGISNRFIIYVGLALAVVAAVVAYSMGTLVAKPIRELSAIAEKMSELDFDVSYESNDKSEIGLLGKSMNTLSSKLESTISELKSANVELQKDIETKEQVDEMRKEFLSNVSHELKTPIALIQGYAEGLKEGITDDPESTSFYCDVIIDEASRMNNMVKKLLTLNQLEFGNDQLSLERFDIVEVVKTVIASKSLMAEQKDIEVTFESDKEHIDVWADEYKVEEVIINYFTNAINHCNMDKRIKISVTSNDVNARVSVFNTGEQIPQEDIENIWEKFYKVDKARTREYGGNGIGLSIVKAIMEQHKQKYGVINHDNGVEFWFELDSAKE